MSDVPFGFGPADDRDRDPDPDRDPQGPFGFAFGLPGMPPGGFPGMPGGPGGMPGFDVGQLGQMFTQLGQMLSQAGASGGGGPVNYDLAAQMARQQLAGKASSLTDAQRSAVADAVKLAELWLDAATEFPAGATETRAWSAQEWVDASLPTWKRLCDPVAQRMATAWLGALPEEARTAAGPMLAMLGQMGGLAFGTQLGQGLAQLAGEVLTSTDIGVPVGPDRVVALLPENVEKLTKDLGRPGSEVMIYLAAREAAHQRLFAHVGWLRERLLGAVEEYARGITIDTSRIEELARGIDPSNPGAIEEALQSGMFEPQTTPEQKAALARLETLLAMVEGWVDAVVAEAVGDRLPGAEALRETLRRRRATGGPAEQTFATIVGLELRPRRLRAAAELWRGLREQRGIHGRDALWAHPDLMPSAEDLDDPAAFLAREEGTDPLAELERQFAEEAGRSGEGSGDASGEASGDASGEASGDTSGEASGDASAEGRAAGETGAGETGDGRAGGRSGGTGDDPSDEPPAGPPRA